MAKFRTEKNENAYKSNNLTLIQDGRRIELEWIKRRLEYTVFAERFILKYNLKRGEIYEFDWGLNVNAEFSNRHYGVVMVDSDENNPLVTVCPLKSNHSGINPKSDVDLGVIPELRTGNSSIAVVNQVRTIDKLRLYRIGSIGKRYDSRLSDYYESDKYSIVRLREDKLNTLLETYKKYIDFGSVESPAKVD